MRLSIIIVNWNSREFLRKCLLSLRAVPSSIAYEIIVVDNASYDGCEEMLAAEFPEVLFIQAGDNLGFARANNLAAERAKGSYFLFLNPDTEVVGDAIDSLVAVADRNERAGIVGARLLNSDNSIQIESVKAFPTILNQVLESQLLQRMFPRSTLWGISPLFSESTEPASVDVVSGACMLVKREAFTSIGGFNARYFMYSEDVDICWTAKRAGWSVLFAAGARVIHHGGGSSALASVSNFSAVLMRESRFRFFQRSRGRMYPVAYRCAMACVAVGRVVLLVVAYPFIRWSTGGTPTAAIRKWTRVFRWSLGLEPWAKAIGLGR